MHLLCTCHAFGAAFLRLVLPRFSRFGYSWRTWPRAMPIRAISNASTGKNDPGGFRTHDLRIKSPLLYQLSYRVLVALKIMGPHSSGRYHKSSLGAIGGRPAV